MKDLKTLYNTNESFQLYVDKFANAYHLDVDDALTFSMVLSVSEAYTPNKVN